MKTIDNFLRNPTNNDLINKIKEKYIIVGNLPRKDKKEIRFQLLNMYKRTIIRLKNK